MSIVAAFDKTLFYNEASKYCVLRLKTADPAVPEEARSPYKFSDHLIRFVAVGYDLPQTDSVRMELEGTWTKGKYGCQLQVERWHEIVPPTIEGIHGYLSSGLLKGIGPKTADAIVQRFGLQSLYVLEHQPEKLLEIRGITEDRLEKIKSGYAESKAMRDLMALLSPFKVTPTTALKIYHHFGRAVCRCCGKVRSGCARSQASALGAWTPLFRSRAAISTTPCGSRGHCSTLWRSPVPRAATSIWRRRSWPGRPFCS